MYILTSDDGTVKILTNEGKLWYEGEINLQSKLFGSGNLCFTGSGSVQYKGRFINGFPVTRV